MCRWMGGIRFTVGALQQILLSKTHTAHIAILPQEPAEALLADVPSDSRSGAATDVIASITSRSVGDNNVHRDTLHVHNN